MNKIALALAAVIGLGVAGPAFAAISDSGSVGAFVQLQRAPLPQHHQPAQPAHPATIVRK
jgi:hypothetical protein